MSDERAQMVALAKAIHQRMREWEAVNAADFKIDNALSRILENDPDYAPYRPRAKDKARGPAVEPSVFTIKRIAERLDTTVAVYIRSEGGMLGYWHQEAKGHVVLQKHNPDYDPVPLGHPSEWFLVGTITKIVEAPLPRL